MKSPRSLKARALQLLAQREQSRVELRRKLLAHLRAGEANTGPIDAVEATNQVDALLDWLDAQQFSSDARFAESRVHARSSGYGNLRIGQELKQHQVSLTPEARRALDESEPARAEALYRRKFTAAAQTSDERARRWRFLSTRGFSADVIRQVLRNDPSCAQDD